MAEDPNSRGGRLARRLDTLFRTVHSPGKKEYSNDAVAEAITAAGGPRVSGAYLQQLRNGVKDNPSTRLLEAVTAFFGVPMTYLFEDEETAQVDLGVAVLTRLLEVDAFDIAARLADLRSADSRELVRQLVDHLAQLEGLPNATPGPPARGPAASAAGGNTDAGA